MDTASVATVIADSINPDGNRLTTLQLALPTRIVITGSYFASIQQVTATPDILTPEDLHTAADAIAEALDASTPVQKSWGWGHAGNHAPYITDSERQTHDASACYMMSAVRCLRSGHGENPPFDPAEDVDLYQDLISADPPEIDFTEHVAYPQRGTPGRYPGWMSLRHIFLPR